MQALFYMDINPCDLEEQLALYLRSFPPNRKAHDYFLRLVRGVTSVREEVDRVIERFSNNWKISRMSCVDRNVLRIAVFELLFCQDIPFKVSINEAIDIGKKYGTDESGAFINGILDSVRIAIESDRLKPDPEALRRIRSIDAAENINA